MKRKAMGVLVVSLGVLSGCGTSHGSHPISHGMTPLQVKNEVLARLKGWHTVQEQLTEVVTGPHGGKQRYQVSLVGSTSPSGFRLDVVPKSGTPYEVVDTGLNTIEYQRGARHYSVSASNPNAWAIYRILGLELPSALNASRVQAVSVTPKQVILHMITPIAPGSEARATLWFNLQTNTPSKFEAYWKGGSVEEIPTQIHINSSVSSSVFSFTPPTGARAQVALTTQGTELDQAQAHVTFPIVLPPSSQDLQLNAVDISSKSGSRVVLLTYLTRRQNPLLITEEKAATFTPPSGLSMVTETVGTMTAKVGSLPDGEEMAALTLQKALVVIEGPAAAVDNLVNSWTIGSSQPPTSSP